MTFLLDVNVLIALIDPTHINHHVARAWFKDQGSASWASCPITQNGVLRIVGHHRYANSPGSPAAVLPILAELCSLPGHQFWPDSISALDDQRFVAAELRLSTQLTDSYLLALAVSRSAKLATFDSRIKTAAIPGGKAALHVIPPRIQ